MKIGIFGLGYVGTVTLGCLSSLGHEVIGTDIDPGKVDSIRKGRSPVREPGLDELIQQGLACQRLHVSRDPGAVASEVEISFVCVGTPDNDGIPDFSQLDRVCGDIAGGLASSSSSFPVVAVRSTVLPGVTACRVIPTLERVSGLTAGEDFGVCSNPEFLREGSAVEDFLHPSFSVIGHWDDRSGAVLVELYRSLGTPIRLVPGPCAEMLKHSCNAFHAMKIAFANEIGSLCAEVAVDAAALMQLFCEDRRLNISEKYLRPGFAFGGSCLPKDLRLLQRIAVERGLSLPLLSAVLPSNESHLERAVKRVRAPGKTRIGVAGLAFKPGTDDVRESPGVELCRRLLEEGFDVNFFDSNIRLDLLQGRNLRFLTTRLPQFMERFSESLDELIEHSEVLVITLEGVVPRDVRDVLSQMEGKVLVDLTGVAG